MKKLISKTVSLVLALAMLASCFAGFGTEAFAATMKSKKIDGIIYRYTIEKDIARIKSVDSGKNTTIAFPSKLDGKNVGAIDTDAVNDNNYVKAVKIPNTVTKLSKYAFSCCLNLATVNIGSGLRVIENDPFFNCGIVKFVVDKNNKYFTTYADSLYNKSKTTIIKYTTGKATKEVTLPKSVTTIGYGAFEFSNYLTKINMPSVTKISDFAFYFCKNLTSAALPSRLKAIGSDAFRKTGLKSVTLPSSLTSMGSNAYSSCEKLVSVDMSKTQLKNVSELAFFESRNLKTVKLPSKVTTIGSYAFEKTGLETFVAPSTITKIGGAAFERNDNLKSVDLSKTKITVVENCLFTSSPKLATIKLPKTVKRIGRGAFIRTAISSFRIPESVTVIDKDAFFSCTKLSSVTLPSNIKVINDGTFSYCDSLKSIVIPASVTNVYAYAFEGSKNLSKVTFKSKATKCSARAFEGCNSITIYAPSGADTQATAKKLGYKFVAI